MQLPLNTEKLLQNDVIRCCNLPCHILCACTWEVGRFFGVGFCFVLFTQRIP